MRRIARIAVLTCVAFVLGAPHALAKDLCLSLPAVTGTVVYAFQEFTVPPKNKCKAVSGASTVHGFLLSGSACTSADGSTVRLGFGAHPLSPGTVSFDVGCNLPLPVGADGSCEGTSFAPGATQEVRAFSGLATVEICTADVP